MIIGIGTDLANIDRIQAVLERHGDRFRNRVFTDIEQSKAKRRMDEAERLPNAGPQKRPVPRHWGQVCAWGSHGKTWPCTT